MPDIETLPAPATAPSWPRYLVATGAAVALLLLGAAAGVLIGLPGSASKAVPGADSVDVGFAQDMTVHHEQAVEMATWARDHSTDPQVRLLAYDIESGQSRQIGHMQGWLALWGAPGLPTGPHMGWMSGADSHGHRGSGMAGVTGTDRMPGMATEDDLRQLRASTGRELDVLFLQLMLRHHEGGTAMLAYAAQHAATPDVRTQAGKMLAAQTNESRYLRELLAARNAAPLPG